MIENVTEYGSPPYSSYETTGGNGRAPLRKLMAALNMPGILGFGLVGDRPGGPPVAPLGRLDFELPEEPDEAAAKAAFR